MGWRGHKKIRQVDRQERVRLARRQFNGQIIDLAGASQGGHARGGDTNLAGVKVGSILVQHFSNVPYHRIGVERGPIMEFHTAAQFEGPFGLVLGINAPRGR